jgi:glycosyltransferase involved in cell wall biosynthesis
MNAQTSKISIVIPLYNEQDSLAELHQNIVSVMEGSDRAFEIIFVDDGSTDGSAAVLAKVYSGDRRVKVIQFRKNYGKSAALSAGFSAATGNSIVTMDADLQDDPTEIPNLLAKLDEGYDLVSGWKKVRRDPFSKRVASRIYNFFTYVFGGVHLHDFNCGLKAYRAKVVESIKIYGELHRYIPVLAHREGFRVTELPVKHHERIYGKTKFGMGRFGRGAFDLITVSFLTKYRKRPLHLFGFFGIITFVTGTAISSFLAYQKIFMGKNLSNRPLLFLGILLIIVGVQFFSIGLLGEMLTSASKDTDSYLVRKKLGF